MDEDERTNALGLFHFAHSYWISAVALQATTRDVTHKDAPVDYLYFHSIELHLKSFLRLSGFTLAQVKTLGHLLPHLHNAAVNEGLYDLDIRREVIEGIPANYMAARYIRTGYFQKAPHEALLDVCYSLHMELEPLVNSQYGITRIRYVPPPPLLPEDD